MQKILSNFSSKFKTLTSKFKRSQDEPTTEETAVSPELISNNQPNQQENELSPQFSVLSPKNFKLLDKRWKKIVAVVLFVLVFLLSIALVMGLYTLMVGKQLMSEANQLEVTGRDAYAAFKAQNLPETEIKITVLNEQLEKITQTYGKLGFYKSIPLIRNYYLDGAAGLQAADHGLNAATTAIAAITPYADVLGFAGEGSFEGGSAENRVKLILQTLEKVTPQLDQIEDELQAMQTALDEINPNHYPVQIKGKNIRSTIVKAQDGVGTAITALTQFRPIIEKLPEIAGATGERKKYLVLFQNDNELRPTGGFLTAYAVIYIEDGVVTQEKSDDIYELDKKFNQRIEIPEALGRYLTTEKYWNLRDMNTSPDFRESMSQFYKYYKDVRGEPSNVDGIIAIDTELLTNLMKVVGPIEIAGYGTFSAEIDKRCDCPQIIYALSEIITRPTPYLREDRKGILGPLMNNILSKLYSSPRAYMAQLFEVGLKAVDERSLQAYLFADDKQQAIEAINAGGRLTQAQGVEDFVAVVDANLGGAKSNLFINYEVEQVVSAPENGRITKTVTVTYKNSRYADNCNLEAGKLCLNSTLRDWFRLYVPANAELIETKGFIEEPNSYEELGFTVFDSFFTLEPEAQAKVQVTYSVPYTNKTEYAVKLWKQGGVSPFKTIMDVNGNQEEIVVGKDTIYRANF